MGVVIVEGVVVGAGVVVVVVFVVVGATRFRHRPYRLHIGVDLTALARGVGKRGVDREVVVGGEV